MKMPDTHITREELQLILEAQQKNIAALITAAVTAARAPNPIEQRMLDEHAQKDERRSKMMVALGKAEEEAAAAKKSGCSHCRWPASAGKKAGHAAPRNASGVEWCTGGQLIGAGSDIFMLVCCRCSTTWMWKLNPQEKDYIAGGGETIGWAPPAEERLLHV